jgi:Bacterial PH domain
VGIISSLLFGAASEIDAQKLDDEFGQMLVDGEQIEKAYKLVRDLFVFTNRRLILVDRQGVTGKKTEYHSIPYKSISHFSVETTGHFDIDAELKIWLSGSQSPFQRQFRKDSNIYDVQKALATYVLR